MKIGDITIEPLLDGTALFDPTFLWSKNATSGRGREENDWDRQSEFLMPDGQIKFALGGFLVHGMGDRVVVVDLGIGPGTMPGPFPVQGGRMLEELAAFGFGPGDVTDVVFTHLHLDHVGWASVDSQPTFGNATYRCGSQDWSYFVGREEDVTALLAPIEERFATWDTDVTLAPGLDVRLVPGHTPGSSMVVVSSGDDRAVLLGDIAHCPVELMDNEWAGLGDVDPELAARGRELVARELENSSTHVSAAHFPDMSFGRLMRGTGHRYWTYQ
jgi:glyoxylase-like metal-dependent hydrolase (beta-lactamase superfamily II)